VEFSIRVTLPRSAAALLQESIRTNPLQRFGGEGRMAALSATTVEQRSVTLAAPAQTSVLMLLTDMLPQHNFKEAPLPGFVPTTLEAGVTCWEGSIEGVSLYLLGVASGKPRRFGGWDIRHNRPRPIQSYIPAGSCFYVQPKGLEDDLRALHGKQIGRRTDFGFGTLLCAA
jgi:CRISPR-associated protein Cmr3